MAHLELDLSPEDARTLRGALLAARASELAEAQRRGFRHSAGYGSDSARETMTAEVAHHRRRIELLDRLIAALEVTALEVTALEVAALEVSEEG